MINEKIKIIKAPDSQKPFVIIDKPSGMPSAPLSSDDTNNAFYHAAKLFPELLNVNGKKQIEHGLLHRLDTATSGLMIIAATQECYDFLQQEQQENKIIKTYLAECKLQFADSKMQFAVPEIQFAVPEIQFAVPEIQFAVPEALEGLEGLETQSYTISSYFRPYGPGRKEVRPVTEASNKAALDKVQKKVLYTTNITIKSINKITNTAIVECKITNGYRHQVRCHLAWIGLPIINDNIYNPECKNKKSTEQMHFCASKLQFEYPKGDLNSYVRKDTWT